MPIWKGVKEEFWTILVSSVCTRAFLESPWCPVAYMVDSSNSGWGIIQRAATSDELQLEGRWALGVNWPVADMEKDYTLGERLV